jgi:acetyl/propionyl-CoA carboxylase alpha subunit
LIAGVTTTVGFHRRALAEASFRDGGYTTRFVGEMADADLAKDDQRRIATAAALERHANRSRLLEQLGNHRHQEIPWRARP